jgi:magnesium-transporting ATPase (P-type)
MPIVVVVVAFLQHCGIRPPLLGQCTMERKQNLPTNIFPLSFLFDVSTADLVLLASSNDQGGAYIETSSIDGETNLKLRMSANISKKPPPASAASGRAKAPAARVKQLETIQEATVRVASFSSLVHPSSVFPAGGHYDHHDDSEVEHANGRHNRSKSFRRSNAPKVAILTTEPPNASVHTFSGKLTVRNDNGDDDEVIPLSAEHVVLRGAVIRNTEWVIGLACFTGVDTKLVRNSFDTPSKFSQLDKLINQTVLVILLVMMLCIFYLATKAVYVNKDSFDQLFYAGYNLNATAPWPYLPDTLDPPKWNRQANNFLQFFFMYGESSCHVVGRCKIQNSRLLLSAVTLLNNLIPLSLYVTVEMVQFVLVWMISADLDMYDDTTDTRALARSTIVSDLGRVEYIFSDKTGTLTQNVMRFKRCSVDGLIFGAPVVKHDDDSPFHPSRQLLVGCFKERPGSAAFSAKTAVDTGEKLTFNAGKSFGHRS